MYDRIAKVEVHALQAAGSPAEKLSRLLDSYFLFLDENPDFSTKSVRTNSVLRWEYRPGSTLFIVWNRSGSDDTRPGVFSPWQDFGTAFGAEGTHVFMVKFNYWLGL